MRILKVSKFKDERNFSANSYLICDGDHCLLIDCGFFDEEMKREISSHRYFDGAIITHGHFDHIRGVEELKSFFPDVPIYSRKTPYDFLSDPDLNVSSVFFPDHPIRIRERTIPLKEGNIRIGIFDLKIFFTPGHTADSVSILLGNYLFSGDLLFSDAIGRCDLPTGNLKAMRESLDAIRKMMTEKNIILLPGHGEESDSKRVFRDNPYI